MCAGRAFKFGLSKPKNEKQKNPGAAEVTKPKSKRGRKSSAKSTEIITSTEEDSEDDVPCSNKKRKSRR